MVKMGVFPKILVPQNGWFIMENPIKMDDLGGPPLYLETPRCICLLIFQPLKMYSCYLPTFGVLGGGKLVGKYTSPIQCLGWDVGILPT